MAINSRVQTILQFGHFGSGRVPKKVFKQDLQATYSHAGQETQLFFLEGEVQIAHSMFLKTEKMKNKKIKKSTCFF